MSIQIGRPAPAIPVEAYVPGEPEARVVSVGDFAGHWVVLFFYPRDFTFVCPTELRGFVELGDEFEAAGAQLVAASTDSYWSHRAWFSQDGRLLDVSYPVLADTGHRLADAYGVLLEDGSALRATFVIDPGGVLRHMSVGDQSVGRSPGETLRLLHALQTGELCPADWRPGKPTLALAA
jgi:peroxiredoxin 2/4